MVGREREGKGEKLIQFVYETGSFIALSLAFRNGFRDFLMVQVVFFFFCFICIFVFSFFNKKTGNDKN